MAAEGIKRRILAVDDNAEGLFVLEQLLQSHGFEVITAASGGETLEKAEQEHPEVILLDVMMPEPNGYQVTKILKNNAELRYIPIVLLTGKDDLDDIVFGLDQGADDYVCKPYRGNELIARVHAALRVRDLYVALRAAKVAQRQLQSRMEERFAFGTIIGSSPIMRELYAVMSKVVDTDVPVLITGGSGTGKEVVATALHTNGPRRERPFIVQNCSALSEHLLESELFGHVRGAFTGAVRDKEGLFEAADGGTFFLDELGEMSPALQVKLLRVLQDGTFMPVGGTKQKRVDVRILAATNRDVEEMVKKGTFREDLFYRLNVINLRLPALRDRGGDVPLLVDFFLEKYAAKGNLPKKGISAEAMRALEGYSWPGNIRQLENEIQRALIMSGKDTVIGMDHLSPGVAGEESPHRETTLLETSESLPLKEALEALEKKIIVAALARCGGNKSETARQLGISRSNLIAKAQSFGIE